MTKLLLLKKILMACLGFFLFVSGCGPRYYMKGDDTNPGKIVVSAYTQDGCMEELEAEAKTHGVDVKLKDIESDLGWEIFLFPFYKGYRCTGEVVGSTESNEGVSHG